MSKFQLFLWTLAWVSISVAKADSALQIEMTPAWNGYYRPGKSTEIGVRLISQSSGIVTIAASKLSQTIALEAGISKFVGLPLLPDSSNMVILQVSGPDDSGTPIEKSVFLTASKIPAIALVTEGLTTQDRQVIAHQLHHTDKDNFLAIAALTLPRYDPGYESVDAIIIHYRGLKNLDEQQLQALSRYLANCGKTIALEFPETVYSKLKKIAGCNGDFLVTVASPFEFSDPIKNLINQNPDPLPELSGLSIAMPEPGIYSPYLLLLGFCFGYLLILIMTAVITKHKYTLFILPLLATVVTIVIWRQQQPERHLISWLQMDSRQSSARYSALLSMRGTGRWQQLVDLPIAAVLSGATSPPRQALYFNGEHPDVITSDIPFFLLSNTEWYWQSSLQLDAPLKLRVNNQQPLVTNNSPQTQQAGLLKWKGEIYPLPVLQSGQSWTLTAATSKITDHSGLVELMSRYSNRFNTAMLIPFTPNLLAFSANHVGWLLISVEESAVSP